MRISKISCLKQRDRPIAKSGASDHWSSWLRTCQVWRYVQILSIRTYCNHFQSSLNFGGEECTVPCWLLTFFAAVCWVNRKKIGIISWLSQQAGLLQNQAVLTTGHPECGHVEYGKMCEYCPSRHIAIIFWSSLNFGGEECTVPFATYQHLVQPCSFKRNLGISSTSLATHIVSGSKNKKCERVNFTSSFASSANKIMCVHASSGNTHD